MNTTTKLFAALVASVLTFSSCQKATSDNPAKTKSTAHLYCSFNTHHYSVRSSDIDISLVQDKVDLIDKWSSKDSVTVDLGEWAPGTYELDGSTTCKGTDVFNRPITYSSWAKKGFQLSAGKDTTIVLDNWQ